VVTYLTCAQKSGNKIDFPAIEDMGKHKTGNSAPAPSPATLDRNTRPVPAKARELPQPRLATMKPTCPKTPIRRRRKTFADGSQVIVSNSGYEIFEGIPKSKNARLKLKPKRSLSSSPSNSPSAES